MPGHEEKVDTVIGLITGKKLDRTMPVYLRCLEWLGFWPEEVPEAKKRMLIGTVCTTFQVDEPTLLRDISLGKPERKQVLQQFEDESVLRVLLPKGGWFEWYDKFTLRTESPLSFHIASSLCALGSAIGRKAWVDMGHWNIFPNFCTILIGPTGRVKKSTSIGIARKLVEEATTCPIMSDQMTPEAFLTALCKHGGHQFVCAPEFSVLFNKMRYNDGFITKILRMLDCPDSFEVNTMARGIESISGLALSIIGGSTLSLLATATPGEVLSSGFLNRFTLVVENNTARCFPIPDLNGGSQYRAKLIEQLKRIKSFSGPFRLKNDAYNNFYDPWYRERAKFLRNAPDEMTAEVLERSPDHLLRLSMLVHAVQCDNQMICEDCLKASAAIMAYFEQRIPQLIGNISQNLNSQDTEYVLVSLQRAGGACQHSELLHKCSHRMDATAFKRHIGTLMETKQVREEIRGKGLKFYVTEIT